MTHLMQDSEDAQDRAKAIARYNAIKDGYEKVVENYRRNVPDGEIGEAIQQADRLAKEIFSTTDNELIPAIEAGTRKHSNESTPSWSSYSISIKYRSSTLAAPSAATRKTLSPKQLPRLQARSRFFSAMVFSSFCYQVFWRTDCVFPSFVRKTLSKKTSARSMRSTFYRLSSNSINLAISCLPTTFS